MKPEILQIAPMLPRVEAALGEAYVVHRYWEAADRAALLAEAGPRIRGGGDRRPLRHRARDHGGAAEARDRGELRRRLRRDRHRRLQGARRAGHEHPRRPERRRGRADARPDARASAGASRRPTPSSATGAWLERRLRPDRRADRRPCRHPRPRAHRQGDRPPAAGDADARLLPRPPRAASRALRLSIPTSRRWRATSTGSS